MAYPLLLHSKHSASDVRYENLGQWLVPWVFTSLEEEYAALKTSTGLIDYSTQALIEVQGADRASFLHNLLTQHIKKLTPGAGAGAALLTANGKLIATFLVLCEADSLWLMCDAVQAALITAALNRYLFSEQVVISNHEREQAVFAIEGPRAFETLQQLMKTPVALANENDHQRILLNGIPLWLIRHSLIGGTGVWCIIASNHAERFYRLFQESGVARVGWEALNAARIEAGIPWFGIDMTDDNLLPETGLEPAVASDNKGCYLGQEIVARLGTYGSLNKKLMGLRIDGSVVPKTGDALVSGDDTVGMITSACWPPTLKQPIALGYLKRGYYEPGKSVGILTDGRRIQATVVERGCFNPANSGQIPASG